MTGVGGEFYDACQCFVAVGRSVGTERNDGLALEVVAFGKGADNHRGRPPPYGATDEYRIVLVPVLGFRLDGRTGVVVLFFLCYLCAFGIVCGVGYCGFDTEDVCSGLPGNFLCHALCRAAPTEIGDQNLGVAARLFGVFRLVRIFRGVVFSVIGRFDSRCFGFVVFVGRTSSWRYGCHGYQQVNQIFFHIYIVV